MEDSSGVRGSAVSATAVFSLINAFLPVLVLPCIRTGPARATSRARRTCVGAPSISVGAMVPETSPHPRTST